MFVGRDSSWGDAIVVSSASSPSVRFLATIAGHRCFLLSKDVRWSSLVVRSCGHAIVVGGASSSSIRSLASVAVRRCFSSLDDDRSFVVTRFSLVVVIHSLVREDCDRSLRLVVG